MFHYSKREIDILTLVATSVLSIFLFSIFPQENKNMINILNEISNYTNMVQKTVKEQSGMQKLSTKEKWQLEIPKIDLKAHIAEGTEKETMDKYIGHFIETSKVNGNIGLAAHNRGYPVNYFARLKELEKYDVIIYKINEITKVYIVETKEIIEETDWSYLKTTIEDKITLITCVENKPNLRLCIQAEAIL